MPVARALLAAGANHDAMDNWGERPLHKAAQRGRGAVVAALLATGANPNAMDKNMRGPLIEAASEGHVECVRLLLEAGAHESTKTTYESTPLSVAKGDEVKALLRAKAASRDADTAAEAARLRAAHEEQMRNAVPTAEPVCEDPAGDVPRSLETISADEASGHTIELNSGAAPVKRVVVQPTAEEAAKAAEAMRNMERARRSVMGEVGDEEEL